MVLDNQAGISNIDWTVYGKIRSITKNTGNINYSYDPTGNRVQKKVGDLSTFYVRNAQGNSLAIYDDKNSTVNWREQHLYGSSRLGTWNPNISLANGGATTAWDTIGKKSFELTNHLGNVMGAVSDKRLPNGANYAPDVLSAQDYYPFGMVQPGRSFNLGGYRYSFNGKENDNEVKGVGNSIDFNFKIYDARTGRFLSTAPSSNQLPWNSSYSFAENRPIDGIDFKGLEYTL